MNDLLSASNAVFGGLAVMTFSTRYFLSLGNIALSLVLGVLAMGFFFLYLPDTFLQLQRGATVDRKSTRLNSSHRNTSRMPSSA